VKRTTQALCVPLLATALATSGCAPKSAGSANSGPINLMVMESQTGVAGVDQTLPLGAQAAASAVNAAGGINGRHINVITCDTASDPNKATECARQAITQKVSAVVGSFDPVGITTSLPVLRAANIPSLAPIGFMPVEYSSPNSFPVEGGAPAAIFGMAAAAVDARCKKVGTFGDPVADPRQTAALVASIKKAGAEAFLVNLPSETSDPTPQVTQLLGEKPDCVAVALSGQLTVQLFTAIRHAGSKVQLISAVNALLPPYLKALGNDAEGIIAVADAPAPTDPKLQAFVADMKKYQPSVHVNGFTLAGWYGVEAFAQTTRGMSDLSAAAVLRKAGSITTLKLPGLNPVDFTKTISSTLYPRMFHPYVQYYQVKGGQYVPKDTQWHMIAQYLP
jgi:branched-chain amino acid transport system substrate-binding protein